MASQYSIDQQQQQAPYTHNQYSPTEQANLHDTHEDDGQDRMSSQPLNLDHLPIYQQPSAPYYPGLTPPGKILALQTLTTLSTIVFTAIPVVIKAGPEISWGYWYSWKDALRLLEPFCSGLLHFWFFYASDLMRPEWVPRTRKVLQQEGEYGSSISRISSTAPIRMGSKQDIPLSDTSCVSDIDAEYGVGPNYRQRQAQRRTGFKHSSTFKSSLSGVFMFFLIVAAHSGRVL
ncbi:hypothetical protein BGZ92_006078 [Podila epicladia]|nr:hypothetical protein BGZ92_006078 [Podila epicladia]